MPLLIALVIGMLDARQTLADSIPSVCERNHVTTLELLRERSNRLSFGNQGGLIDGGVCWWHSRFERAASYLADFHPELPKPSRKQARRICNDLSHMRVTRIPGYENLAQFSRDFESEIQSELNEWQLRDGFLKQEWIRGLSGKTKTTATKLRKHMNQIVARFKKNPHPLFLMLQFPGITSHAYLLIDATKTAEGYELDVIDSNHPGSIRTQVYLSGDPSLYDHGTPFIPYPGFNQDILSVQKSKALHCSLSSDQ